MDHFAERTRPFLNRQTGRILAAQALAALLSGLAAPAGAGCWAVYDEGYRQSLQKISGMAYPSRAGNFSSMEECRSALGTMMSDPQYRYDAGLGRTRCECGPAAGNSAGGGYGAGYGGSFQQQIVTAAVSSFLNALLSGINAPPGPDGDAVRKELQRKWDREEKDRLAAEKKARDDAFVHAQRDALALLGNRPAGGPAAPSPAAADGGVYIGIGTVPRLLRESGITPEEWASSRRWQARIDELAGKRPRSAAEDRELAELEAKRNALWKRSAQVAGLSRRDRDAIRIKLFRQDGDAVDGSAERLIEAREKSPESASAHRTFFTPGLVEGSVTYGLQAAAEQGGEAYLDWLAGGKTVVKFGDAYAVGGVALALSRGKPEEAAAPSVNWILGKLPLSAASVGTAQGVGAVTTTVFRKSWDHFLEEADKVVPGTLPAGGADAFWKEMKEDATTGQKAVFEWLGM